MGCTGSRGKYEPEPAKKAASLATITPSDMADSGKDLKHRKSLLEKNGKEEVTRTFRAGGLSAVIKLMSQEIKNKDIQRWGCVQLGVKASKEATIKILDQGGIDVVLKAMREHRTNANVQRCACGALWQYAATVPEREQAIVERGAITLIVAAMKAFREDINLLQQACGALRNLTIFEKGKLELMQTEGAFDMLQEFMRTDMKSQQGLQEQVTACIMCLSFHDLNKPRMMSSNIGEDIVRIMSLHPGIFVIQQHCGVAITNLCRPREPDLAVKYKDLFGCKPCDAIAALIESIKEVKRVYEEEHKELIAQTPYASPGTRARSISLKDDKIRKEVKNDHGISNIVQTFLISCSALSTLADKHRKNAERIMNKGAMDIFVYILNTFKENQAVVLKAIRNVVRASVRQVGDEDPERVTTYNLTALMTSATKFLKILNKGAQVQEYLCETLEALATERHEELVTTGAMGSQLFLLSFLVNQASSEEREDASPLKQPIDPASEQRIVSSIYRTLVIILTTEKNTEPKPVMGRRQSIEPTLIKRKGSLPQSETKITAPVLAKATKAVIEKNLIPTMLQTLDNHRYRTDTEIILSVLKVLEVLTIYIKFAGDYHKLLQENLEKKEYVFWRQLEGVNEKAVKCLQALNDDFEIDRKRTRPELVKEIQDRIISILRSLNGLKDGIATKPRKKGIEGFGYSPPETLSASPPESTNTSPSLSQKIGEKMGLKSKKKAKTPVPVSTQPLPQAENTTPRGLRSENARSGPKEDFSPKHFFAQRS